MPFDRVGRGGGGGGNWYDLDVTSSRVRPPLVKGAGCIGPLFPEFRRWPLWFMASIALRGPQNLAPEVVPGASLHSEAPSLTCRSRAMGTIGADCSWVARATTPGPPPQPHGWVRLVFEVLRFPHFWVRGLACAEFPRFRGSLAPFFFSTSLNKKNLLGAGNRMDDRGTQSLFRVNRVRYYQLSR